MTPAAVNGNRLRWWNRLRRRIGFVPFRVCPNGEHTIVNIYGDEITQAGARSRCQHCLTTWPLLDGRPTDMPSGPLTLSGVLILVGGTLLLFAVLAATIAVLAGMA